MTVREPINLDVSGDIAAYTAAVAKIPGVTEKQARAAAIKFEGELKKGQIKAALQAENSARNAAKSWEDEFKDAGKGIAAGFTAVFAAAAAGFAAVAEINEARTEMINLSDATGIALDTLAGVEAAAARAGVPVEEVTGSFEDFGEVLFDFTQGGGRAKEALELLGFEADNMDEAMGDVDGTLRKVIGDMVAMEDGAQKSAVAQQLFGDAGNRLNAILGDGTLEDYIALAETYGTVIDEDAIAATNEWNTAIADLTGVLSGAAAELSDFVGLADDIRAITASFIFLDELGSGAIAALQGNLIQLGSVIDALGRGDFAAAFDVAAVAVTEVDDEMLKVINDAANVTLAFIEQSEALDNNAAASTRAATQLGKLSSVDEDAAKKSKAAAKERADAAKEAEREFQAIVNAQAELSGISRSALEDQRTGIELVNLALVDQLLAINEIEETLGASSATELARAQVRERATRDIQELQLEQVIELDEAFNEATSREIDRRADVRDAIQANIDLGLAGFNNLASASTAFLDLRLGQIATEADAHRVFIDEQAALREEVQEQIGTAATDAERDRLVQQARELAAEEEKSNQILAIKQRESNRLFVARKAIEIATITASGASAAIAAFTPPPVGAGPLGGAFLAGTIAAATAGQIAIVASQKAPQFDAGFPGFTMGPDNFPATLRDGESVLNQAATDAVGGPAAVDAMNQTRNVGALGGGSQEVVLMMDNREVGRAFVGEMGAGRELDRAINKRTGKRAGVRPVYNNR